MPPSNPTGTCKAPNSGARVGALPGEGDVWLPDCELKLAREYWRVFVRPTGTAFILPDPLAPPQIYVPACAAVQHPLYDIVTRYSFCNPPSTHRPSDEMTPADALAVAHYYHVGSDAFAWRLIFGDYPPGIVPDPFLTDVMDACKLTTADDSPGLSGLCEQAAALLQREAAGADAGQNADLIYSGQPGADVAYLLNQLYGIDAPRETWPIDPALCGLPSDSTTCQSMSTRYFYNPVSTECEPRSYGTCGATPKDFATKEACLGACDVRAKGCRRCDPAGNCAQADDCSACPVAAPSDTSACPNAGLACTYGSGCSFTTCQCRSDGQGGMTWSCVSTAC
ncbi:MAG: BPTI/Kunitz-type proteinase inhibitor domain-containing protein [Polyangiales bacterium]